MSLFIDPLEDQVGAAQLTGAKAVEINTGTYSEMAVHSCQQELDRIRRAATMAHSLGLEVLGGHGLTYVNVKPVARIPEIVELNIGHSIVARSIAVGLQEAVREMKGLVQNPRKEPLFRALS